MKRIISESSSGVPIEESISNSQSFHFRHDFGGEEMVPMDEAKRMVAESVNAVMSVFEDDSLNILIARKAWIEGKLPAEIAKECSTDSSPITANAVSIRLYRLSERFPYREFLPH